MESTSLTKTSPNIAGNVCGWLGGNIAMFTTYWFLSTHIGTTDPNWLENDLIFCVVWNGMDLAKYLWRKYRR
jgi:hypothetical protein